jgi:hypothetical protein
MLPLIFALLAADPDLEGMPPPPDTDLQGMPAPPGDEPTSSGGFAPTLRFGGKLRLETAFDTAHDQDGEDIFQTDERLDLELAGQLTPTLSALVSGRMAHQARTPHWGFDGARYAYEPELREAWASAHLGATVLTVGNQIIRWGATDANSPNDVINPADYRDGIGVQFETPLIPVLAARATHSILVGSGTVSIEGVYVPFFEPHRTWLFGSDWAPVGAQPQFAPLIDLVQRFVPRASQEDVQALLLSPDPPDESPRNGSGGARIGWSGGGLDLHLNAFYGWDRIPSLTIDPDFVQFLVAFQDNDLAKLAGLFPTMQAKIASGDLPFTSHYSRQLVLGGDAVYVLGDFAFKADVAYSPERTLYTDAFEPRRVAAVSWAGGVDYMPGSSFQITCEVFGLRTLDDPPAGRDWFLIGRNYANLAGFVRWSPLEDAAELALQVNGQYGLTREDHLIGPVISWRFRDNHEAQVGALFLGGPRNSAGGQFDHDDYAYARYTLSF